MERFEQPKAIEIERTSEQATVTFKHLELNAENPNSPEIKVIVEKQPVIIEEGKSYGSSSVLVDA